MISIITKLNGAIRTEQKIRDISLNFDLAINRELKRSANSLKKAIVLGIRSGSPGGVPFAPLAESTIKMKRSSKPLIHNSDLIRSINVDTIGADQFFVGVNRRVRSKGGQASYYIAELMEEGTRPYDITITPEMRKFFFYMYKKKAVSDILSPSKTVIHHPGLPARPFIATTYAEWQKGAMDEFEKNIMAFLERNKGL